MPNLNKSICCRLATALPVVTLVWAALSLVVLPGTVRADDRSLLVGGGCEGPHVFSMMDISSTMKKWVDKPSWAPENYAPARMDDPAGRYYQVREAWYEVLKATSGVSFGWAVFPNATNYESGRSCSNIEKQDPNDPDNYITEPCDDWDGKCCIDPNDNDWQSACEGWEPNGDDNDDAYEGYNVLYPTVIDPDSGLEEGDVLPLNWTDDNRMNIMRRLAPNIIVDGVNNPHFEINDYYTASNEDCGGTEDQHCLLDEDQRPLPQYGGSPYASAFKDFIEWYDDWLPQAEAADPEFAAEETAFLVLGDFDLGCSLTAYECDDLPSGMNCTPDEHEDNLLARVAQLYNGIRDPDGNIICDDIATYEGDSVFDNPRGIKTYVITFADQVDPGDPAAKVAKCGGTEQPYTPQTKEELIAVLGGIIQTVKSGSKSFSPGAIPPRSHNAEDKVAYTSLLPIADTSYWDGHLKAFLRPVPVDADSKPDDSVVCGGSVTDSCFLWDAGDQLVAQAPTLAEAAADTLELGAGADQRRVWFTMERDVTYPYSVARDRAFLGWDGGTTDAVKDDMIAGLGIVGGGGFCGDSSCGLGETVCNCPGDCGSPTANETGMCSDGLDNDCDGQVDCDDSNCSSNPLCSVCGDASCDAGETQCNCPGDCGSPPGDEIGACDDTIDNDCDSQVDCADIDCSADAACDTCGNAVCDAGESSCTCPVDCGAAPGVETGLCTDSVDNDCDGDTDCGDSDCTGDAACVFCGNFVCDGGETSCNCPADCGAPAGTEAGFCDDSLDNDCDGDTDCADADCSADAACSGASCTPGSLSLRVAQGPDDAEEGRYDGDVTTTSSDLDIVYNTIVGIRYQNVTVPQGATIESAYIEFENRIERSDDTTVRIWAELEPHAFAYQDCTGCSDIWDRNYTSDFTQFTWEGTIPAHDKIQTGDISDEVQEVVDLPDWVAGNAMAFKLFVPDCCGKRDVYAWEDRDPDQDGVLNITWSCPAPRPAPAALIAEPEEWERAQDIVRETLRIKTATVEDPDTETNVDISYVLNDVFHSDPVVAAAPGEGRFYANDLMSNGKECDDSSDPNPGYRCFYEKHQYRRQVLVFGANDGQVHAVDIGTFDYTTDPAEDGSYNNGTGRELFAHVPRGLMPSVLTRAESTAHTWGADSAIRVVDVFIDPDHQGTPDEDEREWRTVAIGGLRRGGSLYYALDITQPDELDNKGVGQPINGYVPSCWDGQPASECGPVPYGAPLWEFTDSWDEDPSGLPGNGFPDLGDTWSEPNIWPLSVLVDDGIGGTELATKFVAIFGGGIDEAKAGENGNWLYMVDIETGIPIYKRRLGGSVASEPAAVDTRSDGYVDTIYIGTINGFMYKVDVSEPKYLDPNATVEDFSTGSPPPTTRTVTRVTDSGWDPFIIFNTEGRPIYYPPSVIWVANKSRFSLAFGTGDREDVLLTSDPPIGVNTFYNLVDDDFQAGNPILPLTQSDLKEIAFDANTAETVDLLVSPEVGDEAGWALTLGTLEKVVTKSLAFGGVVTFNTFTPDPAVTCGGAGSGRIYIINATNANAVYSDSSNEHRYFDIEDFLTDPYVESGGAGPTTPGTNPDGPCDDIDLKFLMPESCKYTNRTENLMVQGSDTSITCVARVDVCVQGKNWKEY